MVQTTPVGSLGRSVPFIPWWANDVLTYLPSSGASGPQGVPPASATGAVPGARHGFHR